MATVKISKNTGATVEGKPLENGVKVKVKSKQRGCTGIDIAVNTIGTYCLTDMPYFDFGQGKNYSVIYLSRFGITLETIE